jgi:cytochrome c oxidase cbb3-type subunit 1
MEGYVKAFIRSSLFWLGTGVLIGVSMAIWPGDALAYRPAHVHANLLGFVTMMIAGIAYHVIPRFTGNRLRSRRLAVVHLWVANAGLALMVGGWIATVHLGAPGQVMLRVGAVVAAVGAGLFIYNIWRTLDGPRPAPAAAGR